MCDAKTVGRAAPDGHRTLRPEHHKDMSAERVPVPLSTSICRAATSAVEAKAGRERAGRACREADHSRHLIEFTSALLGNLVGHVWVGLGL